MSSYSGGCNLLAAGKHAREVIDGVRRRGVRIGQTTDAHGKVWITPHIVRGGFSTGNHLAGGAVRPHELTLASKHSIFHAQTPRGATNMWCITHPEGRAWLLSLSRSGLYRLRTAEEGCLLAIVLMEEAGVSADEIIKEVTPWFDQLRFFPEPADTPVPDGSVSSTCNVQDLVPKLEKRLRRFEESYVAHQRRATDLESTYFPTYWAVVEEARRFCAWWSSEDRTASGDLKNNLLPLIVLRDTLILLGFEKKMRRSCLWKLFDALEVALKQGRRTTQNFIEHMKRMVDEASAKLAARHLSSTTTVQQRLLLSPQKQAFLVQLKGLVEELKSHKSQEYGLPKDDVAAISSRFPVFEAEIRRLTLGTLQELVTAGLVRSPQMFARQAVGVIVKYSTTTFATEPVRTLALHLLKAFLSRRSRLLLNLRSQTLVSWLPWYKGLVEAFPQQQRDEVKGAHGDPNIAAAAAAAAVNPLAREVFRMHMTYFAGVQLPNQLVKLLGDHLGCPGLVKEIAADIFAGAFRSGFGAQAKQRKDLPGPSSPYEVYYADVLVEFPAENVDLGAVSKCAGGVQACRRVVTVKDLGLITSVYARNVVENGIIIERVAVTTTHNLLRLLVAMGMDKDAELLETAARVALSRLIEGLRSKCRHYKFLRDESRRSANACRAFMLLVSLLMKKLGGEAPPALLAPLRENASAAGAEAGSGAGAATKAGLSKEKALVLQGILAVVEGRGKKGPPLMGWSKSGQQHPVFFVPPPKKKQKVR